MAAKNNNDSVGILMSLNEQEKPTFWLNPSYFHDILRFFRLFRDFAQYNFTIGIGSGVNRGVSCDGIIMTYARTASNRSS